jgi:cell division septation protein DedD
MSKLSTILVATALAVAVPSGVAQAQAGDSAAKTRESGVDARDSLFLRARQLVLEGNGSAGRALVDSAVTSTAGTADYATALYWRAALSSTAADAERDYRRVIVEYPFSPHAGDALLALAQLEMARGDRESAIDHLQRFLLQRPNDPQRVRTGIWLGRMLLETNQPARGCAVLLRTRAALGDTAVEVRNQVDYYAARCVGVDTTTPAPHVVTSPSPARSQPPADSLARRRATTKEPARPDSSPRREARSDSSKSDSVRRRNNPDTTPKPRVQAGKPKPNDTGAAAKRFTVQLAAYDTRSAAEQLVSRLSARGIVARVVDVGRAPFRVRVGRYATDAEATTAARELKGKGIDGFVTTTDNETAAAPSRP